MQSNRRDILSKVKILIEHWKNGDIPRLAHHEVHPKLKLGSRERYLYFTLPPSLNFQRISTSMWKSALATWEDTETNYLFFPEKVVLEDYSKIQKDLNKHKLSLQINKHTDIWISLCKAFNNYWDNDPRNLIKANKFEALNIINYLKENKKDFPYLNGSKMSNYWLYILDSYTNVKIKDKNNISIIPDTHVQQCSIHLGLTKNEDSPEEVALKWKELLSGTGINPVEMHPILWNWSRNNFKPEI